MSKISELNISRPQTEQLSANLKRLLKENRISESELAQALNIPVMTVRRIVSGETADPRISTLKLFADYFDISLDHLIHASKPLQRFNESTPRSVPVFNWEMISSHSSIDDIDLSCWNDWHSVITGNDISLGKNTFALESKPSMQPRFPRGTLFIIDPSASPIDGDIILIKTKKDSTLTLRELAIDSPKWQLQPVIAGSEMLSYDKSRHSIIGVVMLTLLYTRRS
jgi:transcriptional regulator with XRE-family HTH domain